MFTLLCPAKLLYNVIHMSNEYLYSPSEPSRLELIDRLEQKAVEELQILDDMRWNCQDSTEHIALKARGEMLQGLANSVLLMAKYENTDTHINLENVLQQFIKDTCTDSLTGQQLYDDGTVADFSMGAAEGLDHLLLLLAPEDIAKSGFGNVYFLPWRVDLLQKITDVTFFDNGTAAASLPTRIPNVEISYYYSPDSNLPQRTIYFRNED